MICLFLDTSTEVLRVSLVRDGKAIYDRQLETHNDHSSFLLPFVDEAFKKNNIEFKDLDRLIVGVGPGSFTGTRVSITVAKVYGYSMNVPVFPISSLEMMIYGVDGYDYYVPVIEDKNDKLYFSLFDKNKKQILNDNYTSIDMFYDTLKSYNGKVLIISHSGNSYNEYDAVKSSINSIEICANIENNNEQINPHLLKPNYIKKIDAEAKL